MRFLDDFADAFDFTRPGAEGSLGKDVLKAGVECISTRAIDRNAGPDDVWQENEPKYAAWKAKRYNMSDDKPNVRTGQMLSEKSLTGRSTIEPKQVTMIYGVDAPPDGTWTGAPLTEQDKKITDVKKAYFAHTGQSVHHIKRPFYQLTETDGKEISELCQKNLNDMIRETNAANGY